MLNFIKKQSTTKKAVAMVLALLLMFIPLLSHIGPWKGAKAEGEKHYVKSIKIKVSYTPPEGEPGGENWGSIAVTGVYEGETQLSADVLRDWKYYQSEAPTAEDIGFEISAIEVTKASETSLNLFGNVTNSSASASVDENGKVSINYTINVEVNNGGYATEILSKTESIVNAYKIVEGDPFSNTDPSASVSWGKEESKAYYNSCVITPIGEDPTIPASCGKYVYGYDRGNTIIWGDSPNKTFSADDDANDVKCYLSFQPWNDTDGTYRYAHKIASDNTINIDATKPTVSLTGLYKGSDAVSPVEGSNYVFLNNEGSYPDGMEDYSYTLSVGDAGSGVANVEAYTYNSEQEKYEAITGATYVPSGSGVVTVSATDSIVTPMQNGNTYIGVTDNTGNVEYVALTPKLIFTYKALQIPSYGFYASADAEYTAAITPTVENNTQNTQLYVKAQVTTGYPISASSTTEYIKVQYKLNSDDTLKETAMTFTETYNTNTGIYTYDGYAAIPGATDLGTVSNVSVLVKDSRHPEKTQGITGTYLYDAEVPTISHTLERSVFDPVANDWGAWEAVPEDDPNRSTAGYMFDPNVTTVKYRYKITAADQENGSDVDTDSMKLFTEAACSGTEVNPSYDSSVPGSEFWSMPVDKNNFDANGKLQYWATVSDNAGNSSKPAAGSGYFLSPGFVKIDTGLTLALTAATIDGNPVDITSLDAREYYNKKLKLTFTASSAYPIKRVSVFDGTTEIAYKTFTESQNGTKDATTRRYTISGIEITIPITDNNVKYVNTLKADATDEYLDTTTADDDRHLPTQLTLGKMYYDAQRPTIDLSATAGWTNNPAVTYTITSGIQTAIYESNIVEAIYSITGSMNNKSNVSLGANGTKNVMSGTVNASESATINGTTLTFYTKDQADNDLSESIVIFYDATRPTVPFIRVNGNDPVPANTTIGGVATISADISDNLSIAEVKIDVVDSQGTTHTILDGDQGVLNNGAAKTVEAAINTADLPDGTAEVRVYARDKAGNALESGYVTRTFVVDNTAPVVTANVISGETAGKMQKTNEDGTWDHYYRSDVAVLFALKDNNIQGQNISITDNGNPIDVSWIDQGSGVYHALVGFSEPGAHNIAISATDNSGTPAATKAVDFVIDKTAPQISDVTLGGIAIDDISIPFKDGVALSAGISDNLSISEVHVIVTNPEGESYALIDEDRMAQGGDISDVLSLPIVTKDGSAALYDGNWTVSVGITDIAGNNADVVTKTFRVDNTIPVVTVKVISGVAGGKRPLKNFDGTDYDYYNRSDVGVQFTWQDDNIDSVTATDNGKALSLTWTANEAGQMVANTMISGDGDHTIKINAKDKTGNKAVEKSIVFVRDTGLPTVSATINGGTVYSESMGTLDITGDVSVKASVSDMTVDPDDLNFRASVKKPDQSETVSSAKTDADRTFSFTEEADYTLELFAIDMAGNQGPTRTISFRIDKNAPQLTIGGAGAGASTSSAVTASFNMQEAFWWDATGTVTIYRKAGDGSGEALYKTIEYKPTSANTTISEALTETGVYRIEFTAKDHAGHTAETSQTFTIDRDAPKLTMTPTKNYILTDKDVTFSMSVADDFYTSKVVNLRGTVKDINGDVSQIKFDAFSPTAPVTSLEQIFKKDGIYDITLEAKDAAGNADSRRVSFTIDKSKPVIGSLDEYDHEYLTSFAWDKNLDELVTDLTVCETHVYLNGSEYDGISEIEDGAYTLLVTAVDELGHEAEKEVRFTLDTKAPVFIVTGVDAEAGHHEYRNAVFDIAISLQLEDDELTEVTLNGQPIEIKENMAALSVTEKGDYTLTMKAKDAAGNESYKIVEFTFGEKKNILPWIIAGGVGAVLLLGALFLILLKRRER